MILFFIQQPASWINTDELFLPIDCITKTIRSSQYHSIVCTCARICYRWIITFFLQIKVHSNCIISVHKITDHNTESVQTLSTNSFNIFFSNIFFWQLYSEGAGCNRQPSMILGNSSCRGSWDVPTTSSFLFDISRLFFAATLGITACHLMTLCCATPSKQDIHRNATINILKLQMRLPILN